MDPAPVLDVSQRHNWKNVKNLMRFLTGFHVVRKEESTDFTNFGVVDRVPDGVDLKNLELNPKIVGSVVKGVDRVLKDYKLGRQLGEGAFAKVFIARFKQSNKLFACKIISKISPDYDHPSMEKEIHILKKVEHPNCMRLFTVYDEPMRACLILELVRGSNMIDRMDKMGLPYSEQEAAKVLEGVFSAMRCLHSMHITHRDLKPENLMYASDVEDDPEYNTIKVCDLGLAQIVRSGSDVMHTVCGTPGFMAPEIWRKQPYGNKADMWSIGAIMYWMLSTDLPFSQSDENIPKFLKAMEQGKVDFPDRYFVQVSKDAKDLITGLLAYDPKLRLSALQAIDHAWIKFGGEAFDESVVCNHWLHRTLRKSCPVFKGFPDVKALASLTNKMTRRTYEPGSHVADFEGLYFLESGKVSLMVDGVEEVVLQEKSLFAHLSILLPHECHCEIVVPTGGLPFPATLYTLSSTDVWRVFDKNPSLRKRLTAMGLFCISKDEEAKEEEYGERETFIRTLSSTSGMYDDWRARRAIVNPKRYCERSKDAMGRVKLIGSDFRTLWRITCIAITAASRMMRIIRRARGNGMLFSEYQMHGLSPIKTPTMNKIIASSSSFKYKQEVLHTDHASLKESLFVLLEDGPEMGPQDDPADFGYTRGICWSIPSVEKARTTGEENFDNLPSNHPLPRTSSGALMGLGTGVRRMSSHAFASMRRQMSGPIFAVTHSSLPKDDANGREAAPSKLCVLQ